MPGRAALSFPVPDGVLDMDQILETDPWNQINDFVQYNFVQNILDEFSDRIKHNPKLTPDEPGDTTAARKRSTSSKKPRQSRKKQTNEEKPTEKRDEGAPVGEGQGSKKDEKKRGRRGKSSKQDGIEGEKAKNNKQKRDSKEKSKAKSGGTSNDIENVLNTCAKVNSAPNLCEGVQTAGATNRNETTISTPESFVSRLPFDNSTPIRERTPVNDSAKKESNVSRPRKSPPSKKSRVKEILPSRDLNNNWNEVTVEKSNKKTDVKARRETGKTLKKKGGTESDEAPRLNGEKEKGSRRNESAIASGKKKIGKYERRLIEKRKRREERKIRRHEKKAERAMREFGRHVTKIAQKMGYLPENCSFSSDDFSESSYSSCHCCCCTTCSSYSTCSSSSCSCECSEYTPCSSFSES